LVSTGYKHKSKEISKSMAIRLSSEQARLSKARHPFVASDLESFPCAIALWTPDRLSCVLNVRAKKLLGFLEEDFQKDPSLWISRIHPRDRAKVRTAWKKLIDGEKATTCDFRFTPRNPKKLIALREVLAENSKGSIKCKVLSPLSTQHLELSTFN